ncbi:unnamed protein product, partial [Medioppia subpectinata]
FIFGLIAFYLVGFYSKLSNYPPGPIPLPVIGNLLLFRNKKQHINQELSKLYRLYGPVVTVWVGPIPIVLIGDPDIVKQAFKRPECSGKFQILLAISPVHKICSLFNFIPRYSFTTPPTPICVKLLLGSIFNDDNHRDVAFNSHLESAVPLRKMSMSTIRKYTKSKDFSDLLNKTVNEIFAQMLTKEGIDRPFKPQSYCHEILMTIFRHEMNNLYGIYEFIPIVRYFMANPLQTLQKTYNKCFKYIINELKLRDNNYDESNGRDFCGQFIDAKRRTEAEGKPGFECFNDNNIAAVVMDMYLAGMETTYSTLVWNVLFMVYYSDWQQIMRNEVNDRLGDRAPIVTDKHHLHNVMAFIYETIRLRTAAPIGAPHMTLSDTILEIQLIFLLLRRQIPSSRSDNTDPTFVAYINK